MFELSNNSIIILWADHGEGLGDHDYYFAHGRLPYNACLKIPLMIIMHGVLSETKNLKKHTLANSCLST